MEKYRKVSSGGLDVYTDNFILHDSQEGLKIFFISLIGTPGQVDGVSANLYKGSHCAMMGDDGNLSIKLHKSPVKTNTRKIDKVVNRIIHSRTLFSNETGTEDIIERVVFGRDIAAVQRQAFMRLDAVSTIPLLPEWSGWLWEEVLYSERLDSFGSEEFFEAWLVRWLLDEEIEPRILEAIADKKLQ